MQMKTSKLPHLEERNGRAELFPLVAFDVVGLFLLSNWFAIGALWESMTSDAKEICGFPIFFLCLFLRFTPLLTALLLSLDVDTLSDGD